MQIVKVIARDGVVQFFPITVGPGENPWTVAAQLLGAFGSIEWVASPNTDRVRTDTDWINLGKGAQDEVLARDPLTTETPSTLPTPTEGSEFATLRAPFSAWLTQQGLGAPESPTIARNFAESQFKPFRSAFGLNTLLRGAGTAEDISTQPGGFTDPFKTYLGGTASINPMARLKGGFGAALLAGRDPMEQNLGVQQMLDPQSTLQASTLGDVGRNIVSGGVSPWFANRINQPGNEQMLADWLGGGQESNFAQYVRSRLGLGALGVG